MRYKRKQTHTRRERLHAFFFLFRQDEGFDGTTKTEAFDRPARKRRVIKTRGIQWVLEDKKDFATGRGIRYVGDRYGKRARFLTVFILFIFLIFVLAGVRLSFCFFGRVVVCNCHKLSSRLLSIIMAAFLFCYVRGAQ